MWVCVLGCGWRLRCAESTCLVLVYPQGTCADTVTLVLFQLSALVLVVQRVAVVCCGVVLGSCVCAPPGVAALAFFLCTCVGVSVCVCNSARTLLFFTLTLLTSAVCLIVEVALYPFAKLFDKKWKTFTWCVCVCARARRERVLCAPCFSVLQPSTSILCACRVCGTLVGPGS